MRLWRHWSSAGLLACLPVAAAATAARTALPLKAVWTLTSTGVIRVERVREKARERNTDSLRKEEESATTAIGFACQQGCTASKARAENASAQPGASHHCSVSITLLLCVCLGVCICLVGMQEGLISGFHLALRDLALT